jgi:uncharacterized protein YggE
MLSKITTAAAIAICSLSASASALPDYPFIHASGEAVIFVTPDLGEIDFEISASDSSPDAAVTLAQQRVTEIQQLLHDQGLPSGDMEFRELRKEMRKGTDPAVAGYDVKCAVHINLRDLTKWRAVMEPLMNMPNLDAFVTTFGTSARAQIQKDLLAQAAKEAQDKANAMASGFGKKAGAITGISSGQLKNLSTSIGLVPGDRYYDMGKRPAQDRSELLMVTVLKLSQAVDVIFRIK